MVFGVSRVNKDACYRDACSLRRIVPLYSVLRNSNSKYIYLCIEQQTNTTTDIRIPASSIIKHKTFTRKL